MKKELNPWFELLVECCLIIVRLMFSLCLVVLLELSNHPG